MKRAWIIVDELDDEDFELGLEPSHKIVFKEPDRYERSVEIVYAEVEEGGVS